MITMHHDVTKECLHGQLAQAHKQIANLQNLLATSGWGVAGKTESSEKIIQALLNNSLQLIFIIDNSGTLLAVNDRFATRFGYERSEIIGRCVYDFFPSGCCPKAPGIYGRGDPIRKTWQSGG